MIHGLNVHTGLANIDRSRAYLRDLGVQSARDTITWASCETAAGFGFAPPQRAKLSLLESTGTENALPLAYGNALYGINAVLTQEDRDRFVAYVKWIVPQTRHCVRYYEIWNEWNGNMGFSAAQASLPLATKIAAYAELCRDVYPAIKSLAPESIVLGLVISFIDAPYIEASITSGFLDHCDAVALHAYNDSGGQIARPEHAVARLDYAQTRFASAKGQPVDCYITEQGWANYDAAVYDGPRIAGYLSRFFALCETRPWIKGVWWYNLFDNGVTGANPFDRYGLITQNGLSPKPAYHAYKAAANRNKRDEWGWVEIATTSTIETQINTRDASFPPRILRALGSLKSTGTTKVIGGVTLNLMRGPVLMSALDLIMHRFGQDFELTQGPVYKGVIPAQTTITRDSTWPNGWA